MNVYDSFIASLPVLDDRAKPDDTRFLPMAALHYALTRNISAGVRYEQGYRIGQTDINRAQATAAKICNCAAVSAPIPWTATS